MPYHTAQNDSYMKRLILILTAMLLVSAGGFATDVTLLYWNIQNGMWSDQGSNYDNFVEFVKSQDPDICVWCEAETRYRTDTADKIAGCEEAYLPWNWDLLARRYGHQYVLVCGKNDTFPQVVTSKYPIRIVERVNGNGSDITVVHGAGWAEVQIGRKTLNLVTLHTWPQRYAFGATDRKASGAEHGGDRFRAVEMQYICENTILKADPEGQRDWLMMGDFNAVSRVDNYQMNLPQDDPAFLTHDFVRGHTPYVDVIECQTPGVFQNTTLSGRRIDFIYASPAMFRKVTGAEVIRTGFARSSRDPRGLGNFCNPSDHYPILLKFKY